MNHFDDPRITAYVLGELSAPDRVAFETELAGDPALRAEVEAYRGLAAHLEAELQAEACPALDPAKRELLLLAPPPIVVRPWRSYLFAAAGIAAGLLVAFLTLLPFCNPDKNKTTDNMKLALDNTSKSSAADRPVMASPEMAMQKDVLSPDDAKYQKRLAAETAELKEFRAEVEKTKGDANEEAKLRLRPSARSVAHGGAAAGAAPNALGSAKSAGAGGGYYADAGRSAPGGAVPAAAPLAVTPPSVPAPMVAVLPSEDYSRQSDSSRIVVAKSVKDSVDGKAKQEALKKENTQAAVTSSNRMNREIIADPQRTANGERAKVAGDLKADSLHAKGLAFDGSVAADAEAWRAQNENWNRDKFANDLEQRFTAAVVSPLSTFSADVDTASYTLLRRSLTSQGSLPVPAAVRIEEMINYFDYAYPPPKAPHPVSVSVDASVCPWATGHQLVRIGIQGKMVAPLERPAYNLVFLIDCSGSMSSADKLPLLKECFLKLVEQLDERDHVGIVVYAGASGTVAEPTQCTLEGKKTLVEAIIRLRSGGSTNGASGLKGAYQLAQKNLNDKAVNRVILATDGDFNVGTTDNGALVELVKQESAGKVFLTVLGFGEGNLNDSLMQEISGKGNGNNYYIDSISQGERVLCQRLVGTVVTIAKDVKIQVDFNPAKVHSYRLIGYDNRRLANEDFNDDTKDAGEMGAGHTVTAFYEVIPVGAPDAKSEVDPSKYSLPASPAGGPDELLTVKLRYQPPQGGKSTLIETPLKSAAVKKFSAASPDFTFATSVAAAGLVLRHSQFQGGASLDGVLEWLTIPGVVGDHADRQEFRKLIETAKRLTPANK